MIAVGTTNLLIPYLLSVFSQQQWINTLVKERERVVTNEVERRRVLFMD